MVYLPPSEYKAFDSPPEGLKKYTNWKGYTAKTKYIFVSSIPKEFITKSDFMTVTSTKYVSLYQWWFKHGGKWYMHLNEYVGKKKGENFAKPHVPGTRAWWVDADGNRFDYAHPNQKKKGAKK